MSLWDMLFGQFIDVIEWIDETHDTMVYQFPRYNNEIKFGAKLIVRPSQIAIFVDGGEIADVLENGTYELDTKNIPIMTTLNHWDHGFNSPFKAEVYFFNTKQFINLKWGTKSPIIVRDPEFGMVRLRAFGTYSIRITDPELFMKEIMGTDPLFEIGEVELQLKNIIAARFASVVSALDISILDMSANYEKMNTLLETHINDEFNAYGLELSSIYVESITLPKEVEKALDTRSSRELTGNLDEHLKYQSANALELENGGSSTISDAMGMGLGITLGNAMSKTISQTPPPLNDEKTILYYVEVDGNSQGPYGYESLQDMLSKKQIDADTLIWHANMDGWGKIKDEIQDLFDTPPPLPSA
ncbi:MAG: antifreeze protein [Desulfocapsa sp.]|nr:MAG: antifreeze protein [Desulfocapsa sp.]